MNPWANQKGFTKLHSLCLRPQTTVAQLRKLMKQPNLRGKVNQAGSTDGGDGITPLTLAACHGNVPVVRALVKEFGALVDQEDSNGNTALHNVAELDQAAVARLLVQECGAAVNHQNKWGHTPLYIATSGGHFTVFRVLVTECGADANKADFTGLTPLHKACARDHRKIVRILVEECGADINASANMPGSVGAGNGCTPLMASSMEGHLGTVKWLIKNKAAVDAIWIFGPDGALGKATTAADLARENGHTHIALLLEGNKCGSPDCSNHGAKSCGGCKAIRYCSAACQHSHWREHKASCRSAAQHKQSNSKAANKTKGKKAAVQQPQIQDQDAKEN